MPAQIASNEFWGKRFGAVVSSTGELVMYIARGSAQGGQNNSRPVGKRKTRFHMPAYVHMADTYKKRK